MKAITELNKEIQNEYQVNMITASNLIYLGLIDTLNFHNDYAKNKNLMKLQFEVYHLGIKFINEVSFNNKIALQCLKFIKKIYKELKENSKGIEGAVFYLVSATKLWFMNFDLVENLPKICSFADLDSQSEINQKDLYQKHKIRTIDLINPYDLISLSGSFSKQIHSKKDNA